MSRRNVDHGMKLKNKKTSKLKLFFDGLNIRLHTSWQALQARLTGDFTDPVTETTDQTFTFKLCSNTRNAQTVFTFH